MEYFKELGKTLDGLILVCSSTLPSINTVITDEKRELDREGVRSYSVFLTALNLLVANGARWNYTRKKLHLLLCSKSSQKGEGVGKLAGKLRSSLEEFITQLKVAQDALENLSKRYDNLSFRAPKEPGEQGKVKTFLDIAQFLGKQSSQLSNSLPKFSGKIKEVQEKKGGGELSLERETSWGITPRELEERNLQLKKFLGAAEEEGYSVRVAGGEEEEVRIAGTAGVQKTKQRLLRVANLKKDLTELSGEEAKNYFQEVFEPSLSKLFGFPGGEGLEQWVLTQACESPEEKFQKLLLEEEPSRNLRDQLTWVLEKGSLMELQTYLSHSLPGENPASLPPGVAARRLLHHFRTLLKLLEERDQGLARKAVEEFFSKADGIRSQELLEREKQEFSSDLKLLLEESFDPLYRKRVKLQLGKKLEELEELVDAEPEAVPPRVIHVTPCMPSEEMKKLPPLEKMKKLLELADYSLKLETLLLPAHQQLEKYWNTLTRGFHGLDSAVREMISPENKLSCVRRGILLLLSLLKTQLLPQLAERRNLQGSLNSFREGFQTLARNYSLPATLASHSRNWYTPKGGLSEDVLLELLEWCI